MSRKLIIGAIVLLAGGTAWLFFYFSDQQVIKRKLTAMTVSLAKEGEETPLMLALKMKPVRDFLAPACEVMVPERNYHEILEPGLVTHYLVMYRSRQATLRVVLDEISVEIPDKGRGEVSALVQVTVNYDQPDVFDETHRVAFSLRKQEKKWLLHKAILPAALVRR